VSSLFAAKLDTPYLSHRGSAESSETQSLGESVVAYVRIFLDGPAVPAPVSRG
jgi:hypothetical protein